MEEKTIEKIIVESSEGKKLKEIEGKVLKVGRGIECNFRLDDMRVSRSHAEISFDANGVYVMDLESKHGTKLNEEKIIEEEKYCLNVNDIVIIIEYSFRVKSFDKGSLILVYSDLRKTDNF